MSEARGGFAKFMTWVGIAAALLSFGTAVHQLVQAQGELRENRRVVDEHLVTAQQHMKAGDYAAAWDNLQTASTTAQLDGLFAKLLGGLSEERQRVRTAQEDLAMQWIRDSRIKEGESFAELSDKMVNVLAAGATSSDGSRKADLLAHLGWAYFLRHRSGDRNVKPEVTYREAVAIDAQNPYANVFWGHWILWTRGPVREANDRFAAALSTDRARDQVRRFQLAAFTNNQSDEFKAGWLQVVDDMRARGEAISPETWQRLYDLYYFALNDPALCRILQDAVPADRQLELQRSLLDSGALDPAERQVTRAITALTLEAAARQHEALAAWQALLDETRSEPRSTLTARARTEIKRLSAGASTQVQ